KTALGVMARAASDRGKTRLVPHMSPDRLDALRAALVSDALAVAAAAGDVDPFVFTRGARGVDLTCTMPRPIPLVDQAQGDLGRRMRMALMHLFDVGVYDAAILIGTDIPFLDVRHIAEAREILATSGGLVVGPADDGGYYLI